MNQMRGLLRAKRWSQNPPSRKRIQLVLAVVTLGLALLAVERFIGVPDWMQMERKPNRIHIKSN